MLYLEDFLEMIENLPIELRDKLIEMRELDLQVSNSADGLRERVNIFFKKCVSGSVTQEWTDEQMEKFRQEYAKVLEDADEKVQLANQSYELVERHMRKLDQEISKFKMELEADNPGITEIIERRVTESERTAPQILNNNHRSEKKKHASLAHDAILGRHFSQSNSSMIDRLASQSTLAAELIKESPTPVGTPNSNKSISSGVNAASSLNSITCDTPQQKVPTLSCNLGGSGSNAAIAVAASRAIGATVEMQQGRRTASLKASYEAVKQIPKVLPLGKEIQTHTKNVNPEMKSNNKNKKHAAGSSLQTKAGGSIQHSLSVVETQPALDSNTVNEDGSELTASGWQADPNEPRYCICNDVSYGDMVGCDNEDCPLEWFHYGCVGLQQAPRGKWYCPQCATSMKRRGRK